MFLIFLPKTHTQKLDISEIRGRLIFEVIRYYVSTRSTEYLSESSTALFPFEKWTQTWKYKIKICVLETYCICTEVVKVESNPLLPGFGLRKKKCRF
jgi:hypothetical protein